ncbi:hypothetical protein TNCV_3041561 [Trichonephila clavipes]|nr:hypothetical protein TNCV_3041561 [Trichonephila clavipes]
MRKWFGRCPQQYPVTDLGVGSHTAIDRYNFCREVCIHVLIRDSCKIEGVDVRLLRNLCGEENNFHSVENEVFKRFLADAWLVSPPPLVEDRTPEQEQ